MLGRNMRIFAECGGEGWDDMVKRRTGLRQPDGEVQREGEKERKEGGWKRVVKFVRGGREVRRVVEYVRV
jgi:hypothetical protein